MNRQKRMSERNEETPNFCKRPFYESYKIKTENTYLIFENETLIRLRMYIIEYEYFPIKFNYC